MNVFCVLNISVLKAQTVERKFLVGVSSSFSIAGTGSNLMSFGYTTSKGKSNAFGFKESDPDKATGFNFLPKFGYFVTNNLALGLDINLALSDSVCNSMLYQYTSNNTLISGGPFIRYYILMGGVSPFIELGGSFGINKNKNEYHNIINKSNSSILAFGGGAGIAVPLKRTATFDVMLGYNTLTVKETKNNPDNTRTVMGTIGLKLGFIIFIGLGAD